MFDPAWTIFKCQDSTYIYMHRHAIPQLWEYQLEELALYFLLYTEGANLRHLPEGLWFLFWVFRNSAARMAEVGWLQPIQ